MSKKHYTPSLAIALTLAALPLAACADAPDAHGGVPVKHAARDRTMRVAPQKPNGSGIVVRYRLDGTPARGQAVPVELALERVVGSNASVRFETDAGLRLGVGGDPRALMAGRQALTVDVIPAGEGTSYLHVFTTQDGVTSVASIPVSVGKGGAALPSVGELKATPDGDKLITMPVK